MALIQIWRNKSKLIGTHGWSSISTNLNALFGVTIEFFPRHSSRDEKLAKAKAPTVGRIAKIRVTKDGQQADKIGKGGGTNGRMDSKD